MIESNIKVKNLQIFKNITVVIIYILFYLLFIEFNDPHVGNYLENPSGYLMDATRISESLASYKKHIYIIIIILIFSLIRILWLLKNRCFDIFSLIILIWCIWLVATYDSSMHTLPIIDSKNYSKMIMRYQKYYENFIDVLNGLNLIFYPIGGFKLYDYIEKKLKKYVFKINI